MTGGGEPRSRLRIWRAAACAWTLVIIAAGVLPTQGAVRAVAGDGGEDALTTVGHFAAYAVLAFLVGFALSGWEVRAGAVVVTLALAAALGAAIELVQAPLPYRDAQLVDFIVDVAGAALGLVVLSGAARARRSRSRRG